MSITYAHLNNDVGGTIAFAASTYSVSETAGSVTLVITRSGGLASGVTVDYAVTDGTAMNGDDFDEGNGTLTFGAGETSKTIVLPIVTDVLVEGDETVVVTLSNATGGATLGAIRTTTATIRDVPPPAQVRFVNNTIFCLDFCWGYTARLIFEEGYVFDSYSRRISAYQEVTSARLSNPFFDALLIHGPDEFRFPVTFTIAAGQRYRIELDVNGDRTVNLTLTLVAEGAVGTTAPAPEHATVIESITLTAGSPPFAPATTASPSRGTSPRRSRSNVDADGDGQRDIDP